MIKLRGEWDNKQDLKTDAPFWKAEETKDGRTWVSEREIDKAAKKRWHLEESN